ncbi:aspartate ammonia-lyase [Fontibacillus phaseoli]|uniref:aspartate ammonia-lyase n=1 Tax=Fontibacillus phaseoli TaxID=1416533 RepID=A0A369B0H7_9BACL|nr:aspartate ammonia-lyase [Fontibacillus phaseoli]RCX14911.1 aspartate ammonia-lyase [Fontibacillus phaseoli]
MSKGNALHSDQQQSYRIETDPLGEKAVPLDAYYGIHTARALENFPVSERAANRHLFSSIVIIKKAAAMTTGKLTLIPAPVSRAIILACDEILGGALTDQFLVDALQGGAGTSTHMNVNEVVANRAIELLGGQKGDYSLVHPLDHVNCCQSTNDVYPTALRIAAISLLRPLSEAFASLQEALQRKEQEFADILKLGRTQLMDALPMMAGQEFGAYAKAVARDRWRLYKAEERLREIHLGGTAIGTGLGAPRAYIYQVTEVLQDLTGMGLCRSEFPIDPTQNMDVFVEVSGLLKAAAVNLLKIANDLRLLASGPAGGLGEYRLPAVQAGSSVMAGKVNPVMAEMAGLVAMRVIANDSAIAWAAAGGQLELNAFSPLIAESLLESLEILTHAVQLFEQRCIRGITVNKEQCEKHLQQSTVLATALVPHLGYELASEIAKTAQNEGKTVETLVLERGLLTDDQVRRILSPLQITKPGIPGI